MKITCPKCKAQRSDPQRIVRHGFFYRTSDSQKLTRYRCKACKLTFSSATLSDCYMQKRRRLNTPLTRLLTAGVSQRRAAFLLGCNLKTVARKLRHNARLARRRVQKKTARYRLCERVQFDDMETFEHSKLKPLSITLAVEAESRRILGFEVSQISAKGHLSEISRKKYGPRPSNRAAKRAKLFSRLQGLVQERATWESDQDPHYPVTVRRFFPKATHLTTPGRRGCVVGQGELKSGGYDPLFWLNHTAAELRANVNRLFRRSWCTTKKISSLVDHLWLYVDFHNSYKAKNLTYVNTG